ncbi:DNA alkylation repair protein [Aquimarina agarilytica]|uniref:DNA alkylation repair protein n=1 Tax=Aquimarina agarilytica TaxID=1087449 RepID=UPI000288076E|nr:DNA alkylation repair protein [Aquimarina agarilytica]
MIPENITNRKGPRSLRDINPEVIPYLNKGLIETKNLMEWLAVDQLKLLKLVLVDLKRSDWYTNFEIAVNAQKKPTANSNTKIIGEVLGTMTKDLALYNKLQKHSSDLVRCWSCWAQSMHYNTVATLLKGLQMYAADTHFGVREVVIFATKERIIADLDTSIDILAKWTASSDENIRRFSVEVLRPVGVWTKKIAAFQENPEKALSVLNALKSDESKYVQDAVGNWLNDASKTQPNWVMDLCKQWEKDSPTKATIYIIKRGMRTLNK